MKEHDLTLLHPGEHYINQSKCRWQNFVSGLDNEKSRENIWTKG